MLHIDLLRHRVRRKVQIWCQRGATGAPRRGPHELATTATAAIPSRALLDGSIEGRASLHGSRDSPVSEDRGLGHGDRRQVGVEGIFGTEATIQDVRGDGRRLQGLPASRRFSASQFLLQENEYEIRDAVGSAALGTEGRLDGQLRLGGWLPRNWNQQFPYEIYDVRYCRAVVLLCLATVYSAMRWYSAPGTNGLRFLMECTG